MSYITRTGNQFIKDGSRFRFVGVNCYPLTQDDHTTNTLDVFFSACRTDGVSVVRLWCFNRDADGFCTWHYSTSTILDDNNYNVLPGGVHTGGNANGNANDDDTGLRSVWAQTAKKIMGRRIAVSDVAGDAVI